MIRFAAMASMKNTLVLGVFAIVCVLLFALLKPNSYRYSIERYEAGPAVAFYKTDHFTGDLYLLSFKASKPDRGWVLVK